MLLCKDVPENTLEKILDYVERIEVGGFILKDSKGYLFVRLIK